MHLQEISCKHIQNVHNMKKCVKHPKYSTFDNIYCETIFGFHSLVLVLISISVNKE